MQKIKWICLLFVMIFADALYAAKVPVYTEKMNAIVVTAQQPRFMIKLKSNKTTGYSWFLIKDYDQNMLRLINHTYQASPNRHLMAAPGVETWLFQFKSKKIIPAQKTTLHFSYVRPWNAKDIAVKLSYVVTSK